MLKAVKQTLKNKIGDDKLVDNLFLSFQKISEEFVAQKPVDLLQNTGLFVESALRVAEYFVLGAHTPLAKKFDVDNCIKKLEGASGSVGLKIHVARLSRAIYDFRSRKKAVHLKAVDPQAIDANLVFNVCNWILIEILKESGIKDAESTIKMLFTRKVPLVQGVEDILRTTNPKLSGPQRILLLLYSAPSGLTEDQLYRGTRQKIKNSNHLRTNLRNMDAADLVHNHSDGRWTLFGRGFHEAEKIISKFA